MENFTIEKFNPTIQELTELSEGYKGLKINWIDDNEWYEIVKRAQLDLRDKRNAIAKLWKSMRDWANAYVKKVLEEERKLIAIIEGTEQGLKAERERIDKEKEMEKRKGLLPIRKQELFELWVSEFDQEKLLLMSDFEFMNLKQELNAEIQRKEQEKLQKEREEIEKEKQKLDEEKRKIEIEKQIKEAEEKASKETEERLKKKQEEEQQEKIENEKKEKEKLEADQKYKEWLKMNWYNEADFMITTNWTQKIMRKKISLIDLS